MPIFKLQHTVTYEAYVEAPTAEIAIAQTKDWRTEAFEWGYDPETDTVSLCTMPEDTRPDFTADLREVEHEHDFDDEDTGGCIYCDELAPESKP